MIYDSTEKSSTGKNLARFVCSGVTDGDRTADQRQYASDALSIPVPRLASGGMVIGK
jgi:hypothetical protein